MRLPTSLLTLSIALLSGFAQSVDAKGPRVTSLVYFDIKQADAELGRITIGPLKFFRCSRFLLHLLS